MTTLRNEQDVREEVATPFLRALGYESGTANDIIREHRLRYAAMQLGRKKQNDASLPLGGDADYLLTVAGVGRWVLETKPPEQDITVDDIDQAVSYARHPEVSGRYAAILNGRQFMLFHSNQTSNDDPLIKLEVTSGGELAKHLSGLLSPASIRRDCALPKVDLRAPLAPGYRGEAAIVGGSNVQVEIEFQTRMPIPTTMLENIRSQHRKFIGMRSTVKGGRIWRDETSRIVARIQWYTPHEEMKPFLDAVRLDDFEFVCLEEEISTNPDKPSVFDILGGFTLQAGQPIYDLLEWRTQILGNDATVAIHGQAMGYLDRNEFLGSANFRSVMLVKGAAFPLTTSFLTEFAISVSEQ